MKTFNITVRPVTYLYPCDEYQAQRARGLIGFHNSDKCPNCRKEPRGFELWGENGHLQGSCADVTAETLERLTLAHSRTTQAILTVSQHGYTYLG